MRKTSRFGKILEYLYSKRSDDAERVWIPDIWRCTDYERVLSHEDGQICINPYDYLLHIAQHEGPDPNPEESKALEGSIAYCMLVRYSSAWDYCRSGGLESGTFVRSALLIPLLTRMGVDIVYLLPIFPRSTRYKKGPLPSPFAITSIDRLDPDLADPWLRGLSGISIDDELHFLLRCLESHGMRAVVELVLRTIARDCDSIAEHPDWFYWIRTADLHRYGTPEVPGLPPARMVEEMLPEVMETPTARRHLALHCHSPDLVDPDGWQHAKQTAQETGVGILSVVEETLGLTTAPAFCDAVNAGQTPWSDITYWRMYFDVCPKVQRWVNKDKPPYVYFDTIPASRFPGEEPNRGLWQHLEDAVLHLARDLGVRGVRLDMGHALPDALVERIIGGLCALDPQAIIMKEDFAHDTHVEARKAGYTMMTGESFVLFPELHKSSVIEYLQNLAELQVKVFGSGELPDTCRLVALPNGRLLVRLSSVFFSFLPNVIPLITTGSEVHEEQPINAAIRPDPRGRESVFFHHARVSWTHPEGPIMVHLLERLAHARRRFAATIRCSEFRVLDAPGEVVAYLHTAATEQLAACFNLDPSRTTELDVRAILGPSWSLVLGTHVEPCGPGRMEDVVTLRPLEGLVMTRARPHHL